MFYKHADFAFNSQWKVTIQPYRDSHILFIDDVYQHPDRVYEYLKDIPIKAHKWQKGSSNGVDYYDGQMHCDNRWDPCRSKLYQKILEFYRIEEDEDCRIDTISVINQFRLVKDCPGPDQFWSPHIDNRLNVLLYLNPQPDTDPGTSIYWPYQKGENILDKDTEHLTPWKDSSYFRHELCIFGKYNSIVCFPGQWPHGQTIIDNRYKEKTRLTEVVFF